jgi:disulfide bond formation protein DsbB
MSRSPRVRPVDAALLVMGLGLATIAGAWAFELIGGFQPCALCLEQRWPYYLGLPLAALAAIGAWRGCPRCAAVSLIGVAAIFAYGAGLGVYHAGVEWGWWQGPASCAGSVGFPRNAAELAASLGRSTPPSCTEASWRLLGISFAGYNALISAVLVAVAAAGAMAGLARRGVS